jgi:RND family efflux transporter MFP subunit
MRHLQNPFGRFLSLLVITIVTALIITGCSKKEEPVKKEKIRPAKILTIEQSAKVMNFKFPGKVQALDRVELSFEVSGKLVQMAVKAGQHVKKGDLIARIDPTNYKSILEAQQSRVNQAKAEFDRYTNLLQEKVVAKSTYDVKKRHYEVAVADLKIARKAYNDTRLRASFSGVIGKRFVENYQVVRVKQPIVSLQRVSAIEIVVNAPENVMREKDKLKIKITAEFANYPGDIFPLTVKEYSTEADSQTQTFRIVFTMPSPKGKTILDGMTATVFVSADFGGNDAIAVPVQSIFYDKDGTAFVWKTSEDLHINRQKVEVGTLTSDGNIKINSGLKSGDRIVTAGVQSLSQGMQVREFTGTMGE